MNNCTDGGIQRMIMYNLIPDSTVNNKLFSKFKYIGFSQHHLNLCSVKLQTNNTRTLAPPGGPTAKLTSVLCSRFQLYQIITLILTSENGNIKVPRQTSIILITELIHGLIKKKKKIAASQWLQK